MCAILHTSPWAELAIIRFDWFWLCHAILVLSQSEGSTQWPMQAWLLQECEHAKYSLGVRARLRAVHQVQTFTYSRCIALGVFELRQFKHNGTIGLWRAFARCSGSRSVKGKLLLQMDSDFRLCRSSFCTCDSSWRRCIGWFLHEYRVWTCLNCNFPYHANTECTICHPFSIHFPSIYHCFPSIFQFLWSWTAEAYGLLQPRLSETLSYFAEGQTPSVEAAAENLGQAPKKARSLFFF